jgi:hypothetical protein
MPARRLTRGELVSAATGLVLLVLLFAVSWYGDDGSPGPGHRIVTGTETGWQALTAVRWLILVTVLVAFAAVAVHAASLTRQAVAGVRLALLALSAATALSLVVRVLIDLPAPARIVDQKLGAVLGLLAALGLAYGAIEAVREQRARLLPGR